MPYLLTSLSHHTILITGAGRRIGATMSRYLHSLGARIILHYQHSKTETLLLAKELNNLRPHSAYTVAFSLSDTHSFPTILDAVMLEMATDSSAHPIKDKPQFTALINNASSFFPTPMGKINQESWKSLVDSNFQGPLFLSQAINPYLQSAKDIDGQPIGAIINITDIHAERPMPGYPLYSAAKGALLTLTRALAIELSPQVRVNAIAPGNILWPEDNPFSHADQAHIEATTALQRSGAPIDIAKTAAFLLASAPYITGQVINVDGGRSVML